MTALSANRPTESLELGCRRWRTFPVAANAIIWAGALVAINASGYLVPVSAASQKVVGIADTEVNATGLADGAKELEVDHGIWLLDNSTAGEALSKVNVEDTCYAADDQTVSKTDGSAVGTGQVSELTVTPAGAGTVSVTFNGFAPTEAFASSNVLATDNIALRNAINTHPQLINAMASPAVVNAGKVVVTFKPASGVTSFTDASAGGPTVAHAVTTPNVAPTAATRPAAGKVHIVNSRGVYVRICTGS